MEENKKEVKETKPKKKESIKSEENSEKPKKRRSGAYSKNKGNK